MKYLGSISMYVPFFAECEERMRNVNEKKIFKMCGKCDRCEHTLRSVWGEFGERLWIFKTTKSQWKVDEMFKKH